MTKPEYNLKSITVTLPWPDTNLSPNSRAHYHVKARYVSDARNAAYMAAAAQNPEKLYPPLFRHVEIHPPDFRRRDGDNTEAMLKSAFDGIMDALGLDDNMKIITSGSWHVGETRRGGEVVITIGEDR